MAQFTTLPTNSLLFESKSLHVPGLEEVKVVLQRALLNNFENVNVEVTDCPDLSTEKYCIKGEGLSGSPLLLEVGGPPYLLPLVQRSKLYNLKEIAEKCVGGGKLLAVGAGAGPFPLRNINCEGIFNFAVSESGDFQNGSFTAKVHGPQEECILEKIPDNDARCALLLNLFICRGEPGPIIKVSCKKRIGELNFIEAIRNALKEEYKEKCVGMGGVFRLVCGSAHQHVMRDFSSTPISTDEDVNNWLKFYNMPAELIGVGTLVTHEHNLDLRLQHFHSFSKSNWGGHYHYDTTPDFVEYEAYLNVAEKVIRVDRPIKTHKIGRD